MGPAEGGRTLRFEMAGLLPDEVDWRAEAWLYDEWWRVDADRA